MSLKLKINATFLVIFTCVFIATYPRISLAEEIVIYIRDDVYKDYLNFVNGRDISTINDFHGGRIRRDVVDMILAQQALELGGFNHHFKYIPGKLNFRNTKMLQKGRLLISFDSYWYSDALTLADDIYVSDAVIRKGEYIAGLYTSPNNKPALSIKTLDDLKKFTAVSTMKWKTDWQTISQLPLKQLVAEDEWLSMARMVDLMWIDLIFMPFHASEDKRFTIDKITLMPVKDVAIVLNDSRHFVISTKHPLGAVAYKAMNDGLKKLREKKLITKAYKEAGFFIDRDKITILNQDLISNPSSK